MRFITRRVRVAVCTTETLRRSPSPASTWFLFRPLTVSGRSIAMRGGLVTAKPWGTAVSASFKPTLTRILPPWTEEKLIDSTAFFAAAPAAQASGAASASDERGERGPEPAGSWDAERRCHFLSPLPVSSSSGRTLCRSAQSPALS